MIGARPMMLDAWDTFFELAPMALMIHCFMETSMHPAQSTKQTHSTSPLCLRSPCTPPGKFQCFIVWHHRRLSSLPKPLCTHPSTTFSSAFESSIDAVEPTIGNPTIYHMLGLFMLFDCIDWRSHEFVSKLNAINPPFCTSSTCAQQLTKVTHDSVIFVGHQNQASHVNQ